jgi:hypothetical protein
MPDPQDRDRQQRELTEELHQSAENRRRAQEARHTHAEGGAPGEPGPTVQGRQRPGAEMASLATIALPDGELTIMIAGTSPDLTHQELVQRAIMGLIECTPTGTGRLAHDQAGRDFYTAILSALARQYAVANPATRDMPIYEVLDTLINDLRDDDRLRHVVQTPNP